MGFGGICGIFLGGEVCGVVSYITCGLIGYLDYGTIDLEKMNQFH